MLDELSARLIEVPGVAGVMLGGSRARGDHTETSDYDLGIYYRRPLDLDALGEVAREFGGPDATVTPLGEWGPWVDGGAWLTVGEVAVDFLYRDLDRVERSWADAEAGRLTWHTQAGHPLGVPDFLYAGEVALGVILQDPAGALAGLKRPYPRPLQERLVAGLWEADFMVKVAHKGALHHDPAYVAGCLFRLTGVCAHALHGAAGKWLINEKGAVAGAAGLPGAPPDFQQRVDTIFSAVSGDPARLSMAIDLAGALVVDTADACAMMIR
ncbi:nucleotidyltransferase domain-containing protein [Actinoplanes sp. NPDC051633]|uniref:nucleotidyltransferase domain-containing protein n=1 Tax=Actinoplanes sp. NPDC051633 TaxID=3155670 RepID=UPI00341BCE83